MEVRNSEKNGIYCKCEKGNCTCKMMYLVRETSENNDPSSEDHLGVSQIVNPDVTLNEFSPGVEGSRRTTLEHSNEFISAINETYPQYISHIFISNVEEDKVPKSSSCPSSTSHSNMDDTSSPPPLPLSKPPSVQKQQPGICDSGGGEMILLPSTISEKLTTQNKMITGLDQFFAESESQEYEIEKILADFNEILNSDDPYAFSTPENEEFVVNTVEAFSDLLIGGDNDLLIVVDEDELVNSYDETNSSVQNATEGDEYFEEGYESDLPMVRKSMRKLRPVHMPASISNTTPVASASSSSPSTPTVYPFYQSSTVRPSSSSGILHVTSLVNNVNVGGGGTSQMEQSQQQDSSVVLDIENSSSTSTHASSEEQVTRSTSSHTTVSSPTDEGCATFRPTTDLVFANLHVVPPDLTEALAEASENGDGRSSTTPSGTNGTGTRLRRRVPQNNGGSRSGGRWPHRLSSVLALIGCSLGLTNICRFGSLSVQYGANFTLQFSLLSIVFGIPFFLFHMSIGQYLSSGIVDMWKISPIFQGIGIGLVISQAMIGIYTSVGVSWMFIYFRDSFIPRYDQYRWGKCFRDYRACDQNLFNNTQLSETVPDYFNGVVLQRSSPEFPSPAYIPSSLKFTVAFNLAVVWMLVFVSLSKGLKSYGKVIHGFILIPITALLVLTSKMVGLVPSEDAGQLFGPTSWEDFFFNTQTWVIAAREAFFTWGLFGACVMQITAHNRPAHSLKSDATIIVLITTFVLLLTSFLGNACHYVLQAHGYEYVPSSFESELSFRFLASKKYDTPQPPPIPQHLMSQHTSFLMGIKITKSEFGEMFEEINGPKVNMVSGYQALRLATELFPATMALLGSQGLSPFWTVLCYFTFILFGLAQQLAIWYTVIKGIIAIKPKILTSWESTISFSICAVGFILGLPLCTEFGIFVVYFLDYCIGSGWWIMVLYLLELVAVFIVRGAPYCGENIVTVLFNGGSRLSAILAPIFSFVWNVILPIAVLILSISSFKNGNVRELYDWTPAQGYIFWPNWTRELGSLIQLLPLLTVPFVAIIQSCRYLSTGPPNLLDRIQLLYRPHSRGLVNGSMFPQNGRSTTNFPSRTNSQLRINEDPPPKYTPPPSYSQVSGAKIAKFLRNSIRRSMRRISGTSPSHSSAESLPPPPYYSSVILEMNAEEAGTSSNNCRVENSKGINNLIPILISPPSEEPIRDEDSGRRRFEINITQNSQSRPSTLGRPKADNSNMLNPANLENSIEKASLRRIASDITPREVARILRASFRRDAAPNTDTPPYSNGDPIYHIQHDDSIDSFSMINQETVSSTDSNTLPRNHNFDFTSRSSRNRRSNDSQLGLLANQHPPGISTSTENLNYFGLMSLNSMSLGIANPSFQSSVLGVSSTPTSPRIMLTGGGNGPRSSTESTGHARTSSLTVPLSSTNRHYNNHSHRTN